MEGVGGEKSVRKKKKLREKEGARARIYR